MTTLQKAAQSTVPRPGAMLPQDPRAKKIGTDVEKLQNMQSGVDQKTPRQEQAEDDAQKSLFPGAPLVKGEDGEDGEDGPTTGPDADPEAKKQKKMEERIAAETGEADDDDGEPKEKGENPFNQSMAGRPAMLVKGPLDEPERDERHTGEQGQPTGAGEQSGQAGRQHNRPTRAASASPAAKTIPTGTKVGRGAHPPAPAGMAGQVGFHDPGQGAYNGARESTTTMTKSLESWLEKAGAAPAGDDPDGDADDAQGVASSAAGKGPPPDSRDPKAQTGFKPSAKTSGGNEGNPPPPAIAPPGDDRMHKAGMGSGGGEGSRVGHIVGHTGAGKPIYESANAPPGGAPHPHGPVSGAAHAASAKAAQSGTADAHKQAAEAHRQAAASHVDQGKEHWNSTVHAHKAAAEKHDREALHASAPKATAANKATAAHMSGAAHEASAAAHKDGSAAAHQEAAAAHKAAAANNPKKSERDVHLAHAQNHTNAAFDAGRTNKTPEQHSQGAVASTHATDRLKEAGAPLEHQAAAHERAMAAHQSALKVQSGPGGDKNRADMHRRNISAHHVALQGVKARMSTQKSETPHEDEEPMSAMTQWLAKSGIPYTEGAEGYASSQPGGGGQLPNTRSGSGAGSGIPYTDGATSAATSQPGGSQLANTRSGAGQQDGIPGASDTSGGTEPGDLDTGNPPMDGLDVGENNGEQLDGGATGTGAEVRVGGNQEKADTGGTDPLGENDPQKVQELETGGPSELKTKSADDIAAEVAERMDVRANGLSGLGKALDRASPDELRKGGLARAQQVQALRRGSQETRQGIGLAPNPAFAKAVTTDDLVDQLMKGGDGYYAQPASPIGTKNALLEKAQCASCGSNVPAMFKSGACPQCGVDMLKSAEQGARPSPPMAQLRPRRSADLYLPHGVKLSK